ncbi:Protein kinase, putative [Hondaea fermentalgiana]|uniref:Protein kinase, putative n=1 Tax=Hondaea fermentalgiana TaxID=2315210 RepID=A0A2R5G5K8_9STRA|nr:Protein kinase, putative [Hondaea fermentalgiana]|eukprot:GBG25058.1 Protein kinase, putative [Hondaea fermentalgiana]
MASVRPWNDFGSEFPSTHFPGDGGHGGGGGGGGGGPLITTIQSNSVAPNEIEQMSQMRHVLDRCVSSWLGSFRLYALEKFFIKTKRETEDARLLSMRLRVENLVIIGLALLMAAAAVVSLETGGVYLFGGLPVFVMSAITTVAFVRWFAVRSVDTLREKTLTAQDGLVASMTCIGAFPFLTALYDSSCEPLHLCQTAARVQAVGTAGMGTVMHALFIVLLAPKSSRLVLFVTLGAQAELAAVIALAAKTSGSSVTSREIIDGVLASFLLCVVAASTVHRGAVERRRWLVGASPASVKARKLVMAWHLGLLKSTSLKGASLTSQARKRSFTGDDRFAGDSARQFFAQLEGNATMQRLRIDPKNLQVLDFVGRGAMGEVFEAMYLEAPVAFKMLPGAMLNKKNCIQFITEVKILKGLRHPNIVQLMGVTWERESEMVGMVLELMSRGSLRSVLSDRRMLLTWEDPKAKLAIDIAKGMAFLHGQGLIHRDLKTDNILVSSTFTGKVSDFGTSKQIKEFCSTPVGTPFWRAPEVIRAEKYDRKADVYSYALLLLEIHTQLNPFETMSQMEAMEFPHRVAHEKYRLPLPADLPSDLRSLISDCWHENPKQRPPFTIIRRRLQRYLTKISEEEDNKEDAQLNKILMDQIILSGCYTREKFQDGDVIIKAGDEGDACFIVLSGEVEIFSPLDAEANQDNFPEGWKCVYVAMEGDFFGEMGMLVNQKRTATCRSRGDSTLIKFDRETFIEHLDEDVHAFVTQRIVENLQNIMSRVNGGDTKQDSARFSTSTANSDQSLVKIDEGTREALKVLQRGVSKRSSLTNYKNMSLKYKQNSLRTLKRENTLTISSPQLRRSGSSGSTPTGTHFQLRAPTDKNRNTNSMPSFLTGVQDALQSAQAEQAKAKQAKQEKEEIAKNNASCISRDASEHSEITLPEAKTCNEAKRTDADQQD